MAVRVLFDDPIVRVTFSGTMSAEDLTAVGAAIRELETPGARTPDRLTDLTDVLARDSIFKLVMEIARRRSTTVFPNAFRSAIVAPTPETFGFARMFKILNRNSQIAIQVFNTMAEAEEWLGVVAPYQQVG